MSSARRHCYGGPTSYGYYPRNSFTIVPAENQDASNPRPYGVCQARKLWASYGWRNYSTVGTDFGAIKLDCNIGSRTGYWGMVGAPSLVGHQSVVTGYPIDKPSGTMWRSVDTVQRQTTYQLFFGNDVWPGMSGSPVYRTGTTGCNMCAIAVLSAKANPPGEPLNRGPRLTEERRRTLWRIAHQ